MVSNQAVGNQPQEARLLSTSYALTLLWLLAMTFSIAVAETAMWAAAAAWSAAWLRRELEGGNGLEAAGAAQHGPAGDALGVVGAPLIAFFSASVLSAALSRDPASSLLELREIFLFAAPLVTWAAFRSADRRATGQLVFALGILAAALLGLYQTATGVPEPGEAMVRASGPLGHYMTFSGVLLVALPLLLSMRGASMWLGRAVAVLAIGMIGLTLTRSAWIGCAVALATYAATAMVRGSDAPDTSQAGKQRLATYVVASLIGVVLVALLLGAFADPDTLKSRVESTVSLDDPSNLDRIAMAATGLRLIAAQPVLGIGPGLMAEVYPAWVVDWGVRNDNPHLHNNVLQIAAERGLVGIGMWLWLMAAFALVAWRVLRARGADGVGGPEARAALAALAGFMAMGMFEYNFSDSEVLMAFLYVVSLPLAASAPAPPQAP